MSIVAVLIPLGLVLVGIAVWAFIWAVDHGQFEDLDRAAHSILFDDDERVDDGLAVEGRPHPGKGRERAVAAPRAGERLAEE